MRIYKIYSLSDIRRDLDYTVSPNFTTGYHVDMDSKTLVTNKSADYELIDSGDELKFERFGEVRLVRPDPQALWPKRLSNEEWSSADGVYVRKGTSGSWKGTLPKEWDVDFGGIRFLLRPTSFKHVGVFPEQQSNWDWTSEIIHNANRPVSVLNLFAYTGGATIAAAKAGASVVHLDGSKAAIEWAKKNAELTGISGAPIRYILDDALTFCQREVKRGNHYEGIIMDPPSFGHGPHDELWKIEEHLLKLIDVCKSLLSEKPLFFLMNGYAAGYASAVFKQNMDWLTEKYDGALQHGELAIQEENSKRILPCGIYSRWTE